MRVFDEINSISQDETINISDYFDEMELSESEKDERKKFAHEVDDLMIFIFALFLTMREFDRMDKAYIINQLQIRYSEIVLRYVDLDKYIEDYITSFVQETVDTTVKHIDEEFYLSEDRSLLISVNEAQNTLNYKDYENAISEGKTSKQWITEKDKKVRKTHRALDDEIIPITDLFLVGETYMRFPHDTLYGIDYKELSNCRCTIRYF